MTIPPIFIQHACDVLGDTTFGLSGPNIVKATTAYALEYGVDLPHPTYPFVASNKRTALYENLMAFSPSQQYRIIKELCDYPGFLAKSAEPRKVLKIKLMTGFGHLDSSGAPTQVNEALVEETKHWLDNSPEALSLYKEALAKYSHGVFHRNLLDDLRLSLEKLVQQLFGNSKSLENQLPLIGQFIKAKGGSNELANMFQKLVDYYTKYHNTYVKHDDAVIEEEIEFVLEITSSFMKHLVRISLKT